MDDFRSKVAVYSPTAKILLGVLSASLVSYGIYDAATVELIVGACSGVATAIWQLYDTIKAGKKNDE
jgi:hypothetical protein